MTRDINRKVFKIYFRTTLINMLKKVEGTIEIFRGLSEYIKK